MGEQGFRGFFLHMIPFQRQGTLYGTFIRLLARESCLQCVEDFWCTLYSTSANLAFINSSLTVRFALYLHDSQATGSHPSGVVR